MPALEAHEAPLANLILFRMKILNRKSLCSWFVSIVVFLPATTLAQEFCSEPVAPYCVTKDSEFDSMLQINRCEEDLAEYERQLDEYERCIAGQLESWRKDLKEAQTALENARENF